MTKTTTLKVKTDVFAKLAALKRLRSVVTSKDITWDELLLDLIDKSLMLIVIESTTKLIGKPPTSLEELKNNVNYLRGFLDGTGISTEQVLETALEAVKKLEILKK